MEEKEKDAELENGSAAEKTAEEPLKAAEAVNEEKETKKKSDKKTKAEIAALKEEAEKLTAALEEEKKNRLYLAAEYDNFRRRTQKEKESIYSDALADAVKEILPLFDNLERAGQFKETDKVAEGLALIVKMSDEVLSKLGVTRYGAVGDSFDTDIHNAVMHEENEAFGENEISEVFQAGYRRGDKIIRFAMVKVAN